MKLLKLALSPLAAAALIVPASADDGARRNRGDGRTVVLEDGGVRGGGRTVVVQDGRGGPTVVFVGRGVGPGHVRGRYAAPYPGRVARPACERVVVKRRLRRGPALFAATQCYTVRGVPFIVEGSERFLRFARLY